jgi:tetratricopeptide (TPR) repeat protein
MSRKQIILVALAAGALLRVAYLITSRTLPFFDFPITDAWYHHRLATAIASGAIWDGAPFFRAPFYPYLLGGLYAVFGSHVLVGKILGHVAGLLTGGLIIAWSDRLWGRTGALWAAVLWLFSGLLLFYEGELLVDSVFTCLLFASLYVLATEDDKPGRRVLSGVLFGLAAITRPTAMVCLPLLLYWAFQNGGRLKGALSWALAFAVPAGVVVGLNSAALGRPAGLATGGGINFYIGNHEGADGGAAALPEPWGYAWNYRNLSDHAAEISGHPLDALEVSDFYYHLGWKFIREHPAEAAALAARKAVLSVNRRSVSNNLNLPFLIDRLILLKFLAVRFAWVFVLAAGGLIWWRTSPSGARRLWLYLLLYFSVLVVYFTNERFRLPLVPALIVLAAGVPGNWLRANLRERLAAVLVAGLAALLAFPNWCKVADHPAMAYFNLGNVALRRGEPQEAGAWFDSALALDPGLRQLHLNRGLARLRSGDLQGAQKDFEVEADAFPYDARPYNNLAATYLLKGDTALALAAIDSGLARDSTLGLLYLQRLRVAEVFGDTLVLRRDLALAKRRSGAWPVWTFWEGELARRQGQPRAARALYSDYAATPEVWPSLDGEDRMYAGPDPPQLAYRIGLTYVAERNIDSAESCFGRAALADSGFAEAWSNWGTSAVARGSFDVALERYRVALKTQPQSPVFLTNLAWAHLALGARDSARVALLLALHNDSLFVPALQLLHQVDSLP